MSIGNAEISLAIAYHPMHVCVFVCMAVLLPCSAYDVVIEPQGKALVKTDLAITLPEGCYGRVGKSAAHIPLCKHVLARDVWVRV